MYSGDGGSPGVIMPAPSGRSTTLLPHAADSCKHVCLPKAAGTLRCLIRALKGPRLSRSEAVMVKELPGFQTAPPCGATQSPVRSTIALMKMVSSRMYEFLPSSLDRGQKRGHPLAMFISLTGLWKEEEVTSGRKASMMCSLLLWSSSIRVTCKSDKEVHTHSWVWTQQPVQRSADTQGCLTKKVKPGPMSFELPKNNSN